MKKITENSIEYKRVEKNLTLENFTIDPIIAKKAIEVVNSGQPITPKLIRDVLNNGKI
nr:Zn-dependent hydrolase [Lysinibacillus timonensis]